MNRFSFKTNLFGQIQANRTPTIHHLAGKPRLQKCKYMKSKINKQKYPFKYQPEILFYLVKQIIKSFSQWYNIDIVTNIICWIEQKWIEKYKYLLYLMKLISIYHIFQKDQLNLRLFTCTLRFCNLIKIPPLSHWSSQFYTYNIDNAPYITIIFIEFCTYSCTLNHQ